MKTYGTRCLAWIVSLVIVAWTAAIVLAGCSLWGEPSSTEELLVRFAANPNNLNFVAEGGADLTFSLSGYRLKVPITGHVDAADGSVHGTADVDLTELGVTSRVYEAYVEQQGTDIVGYVQSSANDGGSWMRAKVGLSFAIDIPAVVDLLSEARFMRVSFESDDQVRYDLSLPAASVVDAVFGRGDVSASFVEVDRDKLVSALGDSKLHVRFDEDCLVRSIALDVRYTDDATDASPQRVTVDLDMGATFDGYGTVDPQAVAVPNSVRDSAIDANDPFDLRSFSLDVTSGEK